MTLEASVQHVADALFAIRDELALQRQGPPKPPTPKPFTVTLISERTEDDMDFLTYSATLPKVPAGTDVTTQLFDVSVDGTAQPQQSLAKDAGTATFEVPQDSNVSLSLVYVDDAGNKSAPQAQAFVAKDTIAPEAPGAFGEITLTGERVE